uniref:Stringent starvation protein B n=1 Tax=Panagrellus redivivus TaxID=6233 RepID=A0A7E5A0D5_PANRE
MERLVHVMLRVFKTYLPQLDVVNVILHVDKDVLTFSTSKTQQTAKQTLTVSVEISQEHFYVCQEDSRIIFKNKNDTDYIGSCLFETITLNKPELSELAKQGAEVFLLHYDYDIVGPPLVPDPVVEDTVDVKPAEDATKTGYFNFDYKNNRVTNFFKKKK